MIFIDNFMKKTKENIIENEKMCVSFWNQETEEAYKLKGIGYYYTSGKKFEEGKNILQKKNPNRLPKGVVEFIVKEIYSITPGINAGEKINIKKI
ncbi:MAG: hypothetical protein V1859_00675 [archaeon]